MTKINIKNKRKLKTKKQINKLKGGTHERILRLINFICSLEQHIPNLSEGNTDYGTNYPFVITYFDLKIILLYLSLHLNNLSIIRLNNIDNLSIKDDKLIAIYSLINESCFSFKDTTLITNRVHIFPHNQFNFKFMNNCKKDTEYTSFKEYLNSQIPSKNYNNYYRIYYLFYNEKTKKRLSNTINSGYNSNTSSNNNNTIGIKRLNTNNTIDNSATVKNRTLYSNIRMKFFEKYKTIFNQTGQINTSANEDTFKEFLNAL